jgi:ATP-dependent RNA helicase DDX10/DBP4
VFFSTCAQVRFVHECFCGMQPGVPLTALHGKLKQERRTLIYMDFTKKKNAVMFATDLAARGLDFPDVDWVIQMDAPEDSAMYIHRVGRTARYTATGRALLMLSPIEEPVIVPMLTSAGIPIKKLTMNPKYAVSVSKHAAALLVAQPECKQLAKKAFVGYLRSVQLMPQRQLAASVQNLPVDAFAASLGLAFTPLIPTIKTSSAKVNKDDIEAVREDVREQKNINWSLDKLRKQIKAAKEEKKKLRLAAKENKETKEGVNIEGEDDLFAVKTTCNAGDDSAEEGSMAVLLDKKSKQGKLKIRSDDVSVRVMREAGAKKLVFTEDGEVAPQMTLMDVNKNQRHEDDALGVMGMSHKQKELAVAHAQKLKMKLDAGRAEDYERDRLRIKEKRYEMKAKLRAQREGEDAEYGAVLATTEEEDGDRPSDGEDDGGYSSDGGSDGSDGGGYSDDDDESTLKPVAMKRKSGRTESGTSSKRLKNNDDISLHEELALKMLA